MENHNNENIQIVDRLMQSFSDLEQAIEGAKSTLKAKVAVPENVLERLESYSDILTRQRELARVLESHVASGNLDEVVRHISLINGLSSMIIDDARGVLCCLSGSEDALEKDQVLFC